ncbi:MAG: 50S ribosomal protein L5 [bacterium]|nr:50S ribosomal protein L5 [bacterium]
MNRIHAKYNEEIRKELEKDLNLGPMEVPVLKKIVLNMGLGREAVANSGVIEKAAEQLGTIAGQKVIQTKAKKAISTFKLREGQIIGVAVTLRGDKMYSFLDRLVNVVLPRVRDFQGVKSDSFDAQGNYSLGLTEQTLFPEVDISKVDKVRGMQVTFTIRSKGAEHSYKLLEKFGMPFKKEEK